MKNFVREFRDFINKGDVVTIAVGLIMALYFTKIVDAVLNGVINPIIAAIFGQPSFVDIGFDIGRRPHLDRARHRRRHQLRRRGVLPVPDRQGVQPHTRSRRPAAETEISLLAEIRDELRAQRQT